MTTAVAAARTALYEAIKNVTSSTWRVHRTAPPVLTAPAVFIDSPTISVGNAVLTVSFPIVIVLDGTVKAQVEGLDELLAVVWTAAAAVGDPTDSRPVVLDVGGPSLRGQIITVEQQILAVTLCPPTLINAGAN